MRKKAQTHPMSIKCITPEDVERIKIDDKAFAEFLHVNKNFVFNIVHKFQHVGTEDFEEFYAEGIFQLWNAVNTWNPKRGSLSTHSFTVIRNALLGLIRKHNVVKFKEVSFECLKHYGKDGTMSDTAEYLENLLITDYRVEAANNFDIEILDKMLIQEKMSSLSTLERQIYDMHYIQNMDHKTIAKKLGKSYGTYKRMYFGTIGPKLKQLHESRV